MSKATILDRLAGAMETLGKREGKALTPKQRVAAAQRWNSLADIGENYLQEAHPEDDWPRYYDMQDSPVYESMDEFPDDFDYMWRY